MTLKPQDLGDLQLELEGVAESHFRLYKDQDIANTRTFMEPPR
jgi:hypothetical protein